ncbi:MAG: hypothetical protein HY266_08545 [Deltaproteobacteria bacterium]|nr:hypothetical protein [Deltaproteobacteria bacterium]
MRPPLSTMLHHANIFKISSAFITAIFFFLSTTIVYSGEYHNPKERTVSNTETLACGQCHTMHGTEALSQTMTLSGTPGTYPKLLRADTVLDLCLYCHAGTYTGLVDGTKTPPLIVNNTTYAPSAGDFQNRNVVNELNRHSINTDVSLAANYPPGNNGTTWSGAGATYVTGKFGGQFTCIFCHDQHGNKNYRNLRYDPGNPGNDNETAGVRILYNMYASATACGGAAETADVHDVYSAANNLVKYYRSNVTFCRVATPTAQDHNRIAEWCGKCHTKFYDVSNSPVNDATGPYLGGTAAAGVGAGDNNAGNPWYRHPVGDITLDANATDYHSDYSAATYLGNTSSIRVADYDATAAKYQPFCLSCHYAHGGGNPNNCTTQPCMDHSNLVMIDNAGNLNISSSYDTTTGYMRNTCQQCHNQ